jgi:acyl carrier protein
MKKSDFLLLVDELIEKEPATLKGPEVLTELEGWDSVAVMGFIALVDEQFEFTLSPKRLAECRTVDDLVGLVGNHIEV